MPTSILSKNSRSAMLSLRVHQLRLHLHDPTPQWQLQHLQRTPIRPMKNDHAGVQIADVAGGLCAEAVRRDAALRVVVRLQAQVEAVQAEEEQRVIAAMIDLRETRKREGTWLDREVMIAKLHGVEQALLREPVVLLEQSNHILHD